MAVQCGDQHQVDIQVVLNLFVVRLDAVCTVDIEGNAGITQQADRFQNIPCHDGLENIELEVALRTSEANGCVVAKDLGRNHGHGLALGRVDLTGHDRRSGLVFGDDELTDAVARTGSVPANIVGDLHECICQNTQCARHQYQCVVCTKSCKQVRGLLELNAGFLRNLLGSQLAECGVSIEAGSHRGSANC